MFSNCRTRLSAKSADVEPARSDMAVTPISKPAA